MKSIAHEIQPAAADSRTRILDTAERLFVERGYHGTSLRTVTAEAGVNIASVHYYFRSKEGLLQAIFDRRTGPMRAERRRRLEAILGRMNPDIVAVPEILEAFIAPAFEVTKQPGGDQFVRLSALVSVDPSPEVKRVLYAAYDDETKLFVAALKRACPHLSNDEMYWRLNCVLGAMMYVRANNGRVARLIDPPNLTDTSDQATRHLVSFLSAGLTAPTINAVMRKRRQEKTKG